MTQEVDGIVIDVAGPRVRCKLMPARGGYWCVTSLRRSHFSWEPVAEDTFSALIDDARHIVSIIRTGSAN